MGNTLQVTRAREKKSRITRSHELLEKIFIRIADGESLNKICSQDDMPSRNAFFMWIREDETILQAYELALLTRADFYLDEIVDIADNENVKTSEDIARAKLRVDARKWAASKLAPKKYGHNSQLDVKDNTPLTVKIVRFGDT